jgi:hypothetical protein
MAPMLDLAPKRHAGRREDSEMIHFCVSVDAEAAAIFWAYCLPYNRRSLGRLLSKWAYEERARREERQGVRQLLEPDTTPALVEGD